MSEPFPRLKPFDGAGLHQAVGAPRDLLAQAGEPPAWTPFLEALGQAPERLPLLLRVLAWGMDDADRLWWTCLAGRLEEIVSGRAGRSQALVLAERWLREKDDAVRYEAFQRSREESALGPAAMVGVAAFVSGPSLAPADQPVEAPPPNMAFETALGVLTAVAASPLFGDAGFAHVTDIGLDIARGNTGRDAARDALTAAQGQATKEPAAS